MNHIIRRTGLSKIRSANSCFGVICAFVVAGLTLEGASGLAQAIQTATPVQTLDLRGANISSFSSLSDQQLAAVVKILDATPTVPALDLPKGGTFWNLAQPDLPPLPGDLVGASAWELSDGSYLLDTTATVSDATTAAATSSTTMSAMDESGPPGLPGTGSTNGSSGVTNYLHGFAPINTNLLWLQISNVFSGIAYASLHNPTNLHYGVYSTTNLLTPFSLWPVETEVFPTAPNLTPFTVAMQGRQNLFLRAEDWTGIYSNGLPIWWSWNYFHNLNVSSTNVDASGNTLGYDYANSVDPDLILFDIVVTNSYVNTAAPDLELDIAGGTPAFVAVLVNDTNVMDAVWTNYTGNNVVVQLGDDGDYTVSVGLKGFSASATATWENVALVKDTVFPQVTITNPVIGTISQSPIQFQGFANEPLDTLTYDVTNAAGAFTNQQAYVTGAFYDPNLLADTTNYFQSGNVYLASGANVLTLHATDWAGNRTNVSFSVNFTPSSSPPVVSLVWPQAGTPILGNNVTLQAHVSDITASMTATINGTSRQASVAADGSVWAQNLPLAVGNNTVTLTASSALGGLVSTNFSINVVSNSVGLGVAMDWVVPNQGSIQVHGLLNCDPSTNCVFVNGVRATPWYYATGTGGAYWTWYADSVPVDPIGMADVHVEVYVGDPVLTVSTNIVFAQPINVALESYSGHQTLVPDPQASPNAPTEKDNINWFYTTGGTLNDYYLGLLDITPGTNGLPLMDVAGPFEPPWEYASLNASIPGNLATFDNYIQTRVMLQPGGIQLAGTTNLYLVFACAYEASDTNLSGVDFYTLNGSGYAGDIGLPPEWLQINGKQLANTGMIYTNSPFGPNGPTYNAVLGATVLSARAGDTPDVTPVATQVYKNWDYTFNVQAYPIRMQILDANNHNQDLTLQTNTVIVGQQMDLVCNVLFTNPTFANTFTVTNFQWTVPGTAVKGYGQTAYFDSSNN